MQITVMVLSAGLLMACCQDVIPHNGPKEIDDNLTVNLNLHMGVSMGLDPNLHINIDLYKKEEDPTKKHMQFLTSVDDSKILRAVRKWKKKKKKKEKHKKSDGYMGHHEPRYIYFPGDGDYKIHKIDINKPIVKLMASTQKIKYWLYTRHNPISGHELKMNDLKSVAKSKLDVRKVTVFLVHGYLGSLNTPSNIALTEAFLYNSNVNIIRMDWSHYASSLWYPTSSGYAPEIGRKFGRFINWLNRTFGLSFDKVHLVGFSLGAHVVGNAGRELKGKAKRLTGLDPAGPGWRGSPECLDKTDARYVEVIHTNGGYLSLGHWDPLGHSDHYPNGGTIQPNCTYWPVSRDICSHYRAYELMAASVKQNHLYANKCSSLKHAFNDECAGKLQPLGNAYINKKQFGIFRINTKGTDPY